MCFPWLPRIVIASLSLLAALPGAAVQAEEPGAAQKVDFNRDIRPVLSENCFACHGPDPTHREAELRLDQRESAIADRGGYAAVVPGDAKSSELLRRITSREDYEQMPPADSGKELTPAQIELIRRWIAQGAEWETHWSYVPPQRAPLPSVEDAKWPAGAIDRFLLARLEREGLAPSPAADRRTLIRRVSFDLTGLPPTPDAVEAFVRDPSPTAYEDVVNRLLASPHFGERMAIHWLDLVRYADTVGYHGDQEHHISPYRDYVIKSFNDNLPFDQFTIEQLAGDLLPEPTMWQQVATGYNRVLQTSHEGGVQVKEYLTKYSADRVRNVSSVWMGATMGCAECHDHKFDPITQRDFYSLAAFFADIDELRTFKGGDTTPTKRFPEMPAWNLSQYFQIRGLNDQIADLKDELTSGATDQDAVLKRIAALETEKAAVRKQFQPTMITVSVEPRPIRVLSRGDWMDESGEIVPPAVPHFLPQIETAGRATRLDLARWLVSPGNPLTARVFVNRLWSRHFGKGLSATLDDFGAQGEPPSHPQLLDWLACEFMDSGWDVKHMVRLIVTSRAYRQSSAVGQAFQPDSNGSTPAVSSRQAGKPDLRGEVDPDNRLLWRQSRWRLDAELVRDNALAVSGLLVRRLGGPSVRPYQPDGYYRHLNFPKRTYEADTGADQYRRGVYMHWQRVFLHPMLKAFDAPSREECTAERPVSNTPLAALVLLNDPTFVEAARGLAVRTIREGGDTADARLRWVWREVLSRDPAERELAALRQFFEEEQSHFRSNSTAARELLDVGLSEAPAGTDPVELAAWTAVSRAILNLNETITRN